MDLIREHVSDKPVVAVDLHPDAHRRLRRSQGRRRFADVASGKVRSSLRAPSSRSRSSPSARTGRWQRHVPPRREAFGSPLVTGPGGPISCGIGIGTTPGPNMSYISPTMRSPRRDEARAAGLSSSSSTPGHRGAGGDAHLDPAAQGADLRREREPPLHNIQTLRGARPGMPQLRQVPGRDARALGRRSEVNYGPHTWPVWGNDAVTVLHPSGTPTSTSTTRR